MSANAEIERLKTEIMKLEVNGERTIQDNEMKRLEM